ncbi:MAG: GumC family protein [Terriglobales bacterium]
MARRPITNPAEYLQIARRRWAWILIPAVLIAAATAGVIHRLPRLYKSSSLILIEPQRVPTDMVQPTVSGSVLDRLEFIQEQILSRTQLSEIIQRFGLYRNMGLTPEGEVEKMRSDISVLPADSSATRAQIPAFQIMYEGPDQVQAQQVTQELSTLFISENLKTRSQQAQGTEQFISSQVAQASAVLQDLENQLRALKSQYMGSLPQQQSANLQVLGQLQTVLQADDDAIARAQQQKVYLTSLAQAAAKMGPGTTTAAGGPTPLEQQLSAANTSLATAEQMYTPQYPEVISLKAQVAALTKQVAAQAASAAALAGATKAKAIPDGKGLLPGEEKLPPEVRSQLIALNQEITHRQKDELDTAAKISQMQARVEKLPEVEEKLTNVQNAYDVAKANYTNLLQKQQAAQTGAAMEQQAEGEEFKIVDPANLPLKPSSPNVTQILALGCLGGLVVGLALGYWAELRDAVVRGETDVAFYVPVPMLAVVPQLRLPALRKAVRTGGRE